MHQKILLEEALKDLNVVFKEESLNYQLNNDINITITTPQTEFSFATKELKLWKDEDYLCMDFDNDFKFRTKANFVTFTPSKGRLLIRLSHTKF